MFDNLIESKAKKQKRFGGTLVSFVVHAAVISFMVWVTSKTATALEKPKEEKIQLTEVKKEEPKPEPKEPPPPDVVVSNNPPPKGFQVLTPPIDVPDVIPEVDLNRKATDEADFSGKGVAGGTSKGVEGGTGPVISDQPYFDFQVEKPAMALPGNPAPNYPEMLRSSGVEGEAMMQFVVDTVGRAEPGSIKVIKASHELFGAAVKAVLPRMKFVPAEVGGRKVRMLVQQSFAFGLNR
ncbi:MAG: TonB family protein [Gemmatimonadaceae bacterium]|nr:TonB family protein [Gemmatimonadaceae bacterium]